MTLVTTAYRIVIHDLAFGVLAAGTRTRILALVSETGLSQRTLGTDYALWSTCRRTTDETGLTGADCVIVYHFADSVWTAG